MRRAAGTFAAALAITLLPAAAQGATRPLPADFLGIAPQTAVFDDDTAWMSAARIGSIRAPVHWAGVESSPGNYNWQGLRGVVRAGARAGIPVMPFLYGTPPWLSPHQTNLPVGGGATRVWTDFLTAAVRRFGPGGSFWAENPDLPEVPVRRWQIWNEPNFHYFTTPASPARYAKLLRASSRAIKSVDPGAQVITGGLFGKPAEKPPRAMPAAQFLNRLYRVRGIKRFFDGVAVHPYAARPKLLAQLVSGVRRVSLRNRDRGVNLFITEMGWGSQAGSDVAFEVGPKGQARQLWRAYRYLIRNRLRLRLKTAYWFTWKDVTGTPCSFCDSTGLFHAGDGFSPKPAWGAFVKMSRTRIRVRKRRKCAQRNVRARRKCRRARARPDRRPRRRSSSVRRAG